MMTSSLYTVRDVARIFGLTESRLRYWAQTGFINPTGTQAGRRAYTFNDLIEVRAARDLLDAGIPLQRVRASLRALRETLPEERQPLARMHVRGDADALVVVEEDRTFEATSGQLVIDFAIDDLDRQAAEICAIDDARRAAAPRRNGQISHTSPEQIAPPDDQSAYGWFLRGCTLDEENASVGAAIAAYERAIELDPGLAAAHTNLGNLYYRQRRMREAIRCYEAACTLDPEQAEARYNLANIYEEEGDLDVAIAEYRRALRSMPDFRDAHFNLALALERVGGRAQAIEHWRRYLELADDDDEPSWRAIAEEHLARLGSLSDK